MNFKFPIIWVDDKMPTHTDTVEYVFPEIEKVLDRLEKAEDLIFHTICIGNRLEDGPIVMAYGKENDPNIYVDYIEKAGWITMKETEDA